MSSLFAPSHSVAILDGSAEGGYVGDFEFVATLLAQFLGGGLVAQVRETLDDDARHLLAVVAVEVVGRDGGGVLVRGRGAVRGVVGLLVVVFWLEVHPVSLVGGLCLWRRRTARALGGQQCSHGSGRRWSVSCVWQQEASPTPAPKLSNMTSVGQSSHVTTQEPLQPRLLLFFSSSHKLQTVISLDIIKPSPFSVHANHLQVCTGEPPPLNQSDPTLISLHAELTGTV
ncbi:hypothetical protein KCU73_g149, partial [Aureobasidium melanogenum]